ncbi:Fic family protein [Leucobacter muris]|nr:Fic family protein [Leucobacter muris]QAB17139.1 Fic family protein [Leucobacter muris]
METTHRAYADSHPWLTFKFDNRDLPPLIWAQLGECYSKSMHLIGTPLMPGTADHLSVIYLRRGALASAQIEGNTLTQEEVDKLLERGKTQPPSREYLEQEVLNVMAALESVRETAASVDGDFRLTPEWIKSIHAMLMADMELEDHVVPGEFRDVNVGVGLYRGAPTEDVEFLMQKLCDWLNAILDDAAKQEQPENRFYFVFLAAVLAHLYVAWIHPFGDGNGRTSRLIECAILATSGLVPWVSANVLSD